MDYVPLITTITIHSLCIGGMIALQAAGAHPVLVFCFHSAYLVYVEIIVMLLWRLWFQRFQEFEE